MKNHKQILFTKLCSSPKLQDIEVAMSSKIKNYNKSFITYERVGITPNNSMSDGHIYSSKFAINIWGGKDEYEMTEELSQVVMEILGDDPKWVLVDIIDQEEFSTGYPRVTMMYNYNDFNDGSIK